MRVFLSFLTYASLLYIMRSHAGYIPLRLVATEIFIPVYYWAALALFTFIYAFFNKIPFSRLLANMLVLGLFLQMDLALLELNRSLLSNADYARMYLGYAFVLETLLFAAAGYFALRVLSEKKAAALYLYLPLAFNLIYHLLRDFIYIAPAYFLFHLAVLLCVYLLRKNRFLISKVDKKAAFRFLKKESTVIVLIFLFTFAIRAVFAAHIIRSTGAAFPTASDDGPTYHDNAVLMMQNISNLISTKKIFPSAYDPGYSIFLGAIYKIFGPNFLAAGMIQAAFNAIMAVFIYLIGKEIFDRRIGVLAAALTAVNQPLIMLSAVLTTEALSIPLFVFSVYCLLRYAKGPCAKRSGLWLFSAGLVLGFAIITRAMLLLFPFMVFCWMFLYQRGRAWLRSAAVLAAGVFPALLLVTVLTYTNTGRFKIFTDKQDPNWIAFTEKKDGKYIDPRHVYSNAELIELGINPFKDPGGSLMIALKNPLKIMKIESRILPLRLKLFLFYPQAGLFDPVFILSSTTPNQYASTMGFYALAVLAAGIIYVIADKKRTFLSSLLFAVILYYLVIHVGLTAGQCWRYRIPLHPFFMIFAAHGLYLFYKKIVRGSSIWER